MTGLFIGEVAFIILGLFIFQQNSCDVER